MTITTTELLPLLTDKGVKYQKMTELKDWLTSKGFKFQENPIPTPGNHIGWVAYRPVPHEVRACETNDTKRLQLVIHPYQYPINGDLYSSVELQVTGEYNKVWYQLRAYSLSPDEVTEQLDTIELSLVKAWNNLSIDNT